MAKLRYKDGEVWKSIAPSQDEFDELKIQTEKIEGIYPARLNKLETMTSSLEENSVLKIKNEIENGNFVTSENWTSAQNTSNLSVLNNECKCEIMALSSTSNVSQIITPKIGHKYYVRIEIKPLYKTLTRLMWGGSQLVFDITQANEWNSVSGVISPTTINHNCSFVHQTSASGYIIGDSFYFRRMLLVDLTESFSIREEPTEIEMDEEMEKNPEKWFDGEYNLMTPKSFYKDYLEFKKLPNSNIMEDARDGKNYEYKLQISQNGDLQIKYEEVL